MSRPAGRLALAALGAALLAPVALLGQEARARIAVAKLSYVDGSVELQAAGRAFAAAKEGQAFALGDRVRTGAAGTARVEFPFMLVSISSGSTVSLPSSLVLATVLEDGRVEQASRGTDIVKLLTDEARVRGEGRVVVRRRGGITLVSALRGTFSVEGSGAIVTLEEGEGTLVRAGQPPATPVSLPPSPMELVPTGDPLYAAPGESVVLSWRSPASGHHLEVLGIDSDEPLVSRDVGTSPTRIALEWPGTFRWRVTARDANGLESLPSREGLITVVAK
ncbi:MAG: hypothetical protein AB7O37_02390 [Vicinamibacteria bacterium]